MPVTSFSEPVNILHIHGTDESDGQVSIHGGTLPIGGLTVYSVAEIIREWGSVAGHEAVSRAAEKTLDLQDNLPGADTTVTRMTGGSSNIDVEFWEIENGVHFDPGNHDDFSEDIIDWLLTHPKPEDRQ